MTSWKIKSWNATIPVGDANRWASKWMTGQTSRCNKIIKLINSNTVVICLTGPERAQCGAARLTGVNLHMMFAHSDSNIAPQIQHERKSQASGRER